MRVFFPLFLAVISWICLISCDDNVGECFGVNLEDTTCPSENILAIGQQDGLGCFNCVGDVTGDVFNLSWSSVELAGTTVPGTMFSFLNTPDRWLAEFTDCETLTLFETFLGEFGGFVKGEFAGTLEDIDPFQIDRLSLFINIPGVRTESAVCDFCANSTPPQCFQVVP